MSEAFTNRAIKGSDLTPAEADDLTEGVTFSQATHGFAVGDVLRRSSASAHAKAQGDTVANVGVGLGIVVNVPDVSSFILLRHGSHHAVTITAHGLGAFGAALYLSTGTPGAMTTTAPTSGVKVYLGYILDANTIVWEPGGYYEEV